MNALVSHLDLFPTLCNLTGLEQPDWLQDHSMVPILNGESEMIRNEIFSEVTYHAEYEPKRCVRTNQYKYFRRYDEHNLTVHSNIDAGRGKDHVIEYGLLDKILDREMLFDLALDPGERNNIFENSQYIDIHEMSEKLDKWMKETNDPLLNGKVPIPEGAKVNKFESLHPNDNSSED
ncbi:hypothetical protein R4Z09_14475 [Niallia oryzisoli]|uniref:N-sulphoglucosamine sulphohydrolase C-terminal domain-containing protein n=1 Tax=Niallia oryzisoli TaxID=1737571 RepID=A0ABZ2CKK6_9BACI